MPASVAAPLPGDIGTKMPSHKTFRVKKILAKKQLVLKSKLKLVLVTMRQMHEKELILAEKSMKKKVMKIPKKQKKRQKNYQAKKLN